MVYGSLLQGGSLKELQHLQQLYKSGDFATFDYNTQENLQYYNRVEPLLYPIQRITVPTVLYFGDTDSLATPEGVHRIYAKDLKSVVGVYRVTATKFNHLDFYCAADIKTVLNDKLIDNMEKYLQGKLPYIIE